MIDYGTLVVIVSPRGKRYVRRLEAEVDWHGNDGILRASDVNAADYGQFVKTSLGVPMLVEEATLSDRLMGIKRRTQIIYPKDIAFICLKLGAGPGRFIVEAGCGSGALTIALSWFCGQSGRVASHEAREEFAALARRNLDWAGVGGNVSIYCKDIAAGFEASGADALFLDVREPWLYLDQALAAVKPGGSFAFLLPTVNQVSALLAGLEAGPFGAVEVCELMLRQWKTLADRLRPRDIMQGHTGFLVFCRQMAKCPEFENFLPKGTRERKTEAARKARETTV